MNSGITPTMHVAGQTIPHQSPFEGLDAPHTEGNLSERFIEEWVRPYYRINLRSLSDEDRDLLRKAAQCVNADTISTLLAEFNWRPRIVGAWLAALTRSTQFEAQIGKLLLKSELCSVGEGYCAALAIFSTPASAETLNNYLGYYLTRADLWFDQGMAYGALAYLDAEHGASYTERHSQLWSKFLPFRPSISTACEVEGARLIIDNLKSCRPLS